MIRLFTYCIPVDDGAAPNPFWGTCTLVICKPGIRRAAQVGDWVVGTGSVNSPIGDVSDSVVYAMKVTGKLTMEEYDRWAKEHCPNKIPQKNSSDPTKHLGDAIYDFSTGNLPIQRYGVHNAGNMHQDLSGKYALLSNEFYYFGDKPVALPATLLEIVKKGRGHRSTSNRNYLEPFLAWLAGGPFEVNKLHGKPQLELLPEDFTTCAKARCASAQEDEQLAAQYGDAEC